MDISCHGRLVILIIVKLYSSLLFDVAACSSKERMTQVGAQLVSVEAAKELAAADLGGSRQQGVGGSYQLHPIAVLPDMLEKSLFFEMNMYTIMLQWSHLKSLRNDGMG